MEWKNNPWDIYVNRLSEQDLLNKKMILIYNKPEWYEYDLLTPENFPPDYIITFDHKYLQVTDIIVFYLDDLVDRLQGDLDKFESQIWVAWGKEEEDYPIMKDDDFRALFDIWLTYQKSFNKLKLYYIQKATQENTEYMVESIHSFIRLCDFYENDYT
ncbi:MAG: hypothetical protein LIP05_09530 [Tannerellaceae bacterium]|nr:hypothetical protein [Tannerellaceae bacterium]